MTPKVSKNLSGGQNMKKRSAIPNKKSRKLFSKTASKTHKKNVAGNPMRGGIRL